MKFKENLANPSHTSGGAGSGMSHAQVLPLDNNPFPLLYASVPQAILQALELLLIRNYIPRRSFFIALGHDEEVEPLHPIPISGTPMGGVGVSSPRPICSPGEGLRDVVYGLPTSWCICVPELSKALDQKADSWALCHRSEFIFKRLFFFRTVLDS